MLTYFHVSGFFSCITNTGDFMIKYSILNESQKTLVDLSIATDIGHIIGKSSELPSFIASETYIENEKEKYSARIKELESAKEELFLKAKEKGINTDNPQEYIDRAVKIVRKMNLLNPNQPAIVYQNHKAANAVYQENHSA